MYTQMHCRTRDCYTALVLAAALLSGCAGTPPLPSDSGLLPPKPPATLTRDEAAEDGETVASRQKTVEEQLADLDQMLTASPASFHLGKGDVLSISVYDEPDLTLESVPVRPDGMIAFPLIGDVAVAGRNVEDVTAEIRQRLLQYVLEPKVSVVVREFNSLDYTLYGEVVNPGVYPLTTDVTVTKAIAKAGGLNKGQFRASSVELADLTHAFLARNGTVMPVDFVRLIRHGDLRFDINLQPGDYIHIPSGLSKEIYILGEVRAPALFAFRERMPMSRTLALAEGFTADADIKRIHIVRGALHNPTVIVADFDKVLNGAAQDVQLEPGDIVYVPPTALTRYSRSIDKILPTIQALQVGLILSGTN
jgi:polysaccharide export outer membrane protein